MGRKTMREVIVFYRLCSIPSTGIPPVCAGSKFELNKLCLKSFVKAFKDIKPYVIVLGDYCDWLEAEMLEELLPFEYEYIPTKIGINSTCLKQYEMATKIDCEVIINLECDYLFNPDVDVKKWISGIKTLGIVSPYNHPNYYKDRTQHSNICQIEMVDGQVFRSTETCTMTFGLRKDVFMKYLDIFNRYGYLDHDVWLDIAKDGQKLFVPIPSIAAHMLKDWLPSEINWEKIWTK